MSCVPQPSSQYRENFAFLKNEKKANLISWTDTEDLAFHMLVADTVQRQQFKLFLLSYLEECYKNPLVGTGKPTFFLCSLKCFSSDRAFCYVSVVIGQPAFPQNSWYFVLSVILNIYSVQPKYLFLQNRLRHFSPCISLHTAGPVFTAAVTYKYWEQIT